MREMIDAERRALLRLAHGWRDRAEMHRQACEDLVEADKGLPESEEWLMHKVEAEAYEKCAAALMQALKD